MKVSKLIEKLKELLEKHGDVDCGYSDDCRDVTVADAVYNEKWGDITLQ